MIKNTEVKAVHLGRAAVVFMSAADGADPWKDSYGVHEVTKQESKKAQEELTNCVNIM